MDRRPIIRRTSFLDPFSTSDIFQLSYWLPSTSKPQNFIQRVDVGPTEGGDYFEPEVAHGEAGQNVGVNVQNLQKVFTGLGSEQVHAVKSLSFKAIDGQITALLGHNGAGKSTTMNMLTGMLSASGGSAVINGHRLAERALALGIDIRQVCTLDNYPLKIVMHSGQTEFTDQL